MDLARRREQLKLARRSVVSNDLLQAKLDHVQEQADRVKSPRSPRSSTPSFSRSRAAAVSSNADHLDPLPPLATGFGPALEEEPCAISTTLFGASNTARINGDALFTATAVPPAQLPSSSPEQAVRDLSFSPPKEQDSCRSGNICVLRHTSFVVGRMQHAHTASFACAFRSLSLWAETCRYTSVQGSLQASVESAEAKAKAALALASLERSRADSNEFIAGSESKRALALEGDALKRGKEAEEQSVRCDALQAELRHLKQVNNTVRADVAREFAEEVDILQVRIKESDAQSDVHQRRAEDLQAQVRECSLKAEVSLQKCKAAEVQGHLDSTTARQSVSDSEQRAQAGKDGAEARLREAVSLQKQAEGEAVRISESEQGVLRQLREANAEVSNLRAMLETLKESNTAMSAELCTRRHIPDASLVQSVCAEAEAEAQKEKELLLRAEPQEPHQEKVFWDKENSPSRAQLQNNRRGVASAKSPARKPVSTSKVSKPLKIAAEHIFKTLRLFSLRSKSIALGRFVAFRKYCDAVSRANVLVDKLKRLENTVSDESQPARKAVKGQRDAAGFKLSVHSVTTPQRGGAKRLVRTTLSTTPKKR